MKLTVVGCSGSYPGPDSPASCYIVEVAGSRVLLDLGNGSLGALQRYADLFEVDAVLITHLHVDHYVDLCSYYVVRRYHPCGTPPPIPVYGPSGTAEQFARAYGGISTEELSQIFEFRDHADAYGLGPFDVSTTKVSHPVEAYAIRLDHAGRALTYSGDTGECDGLVTLARGSDLLLAEAAFQEGGDNPPGLHLTGRQAADHAKRADVGQLVITHVPPWHDALRTFAEAQEAYDGEASLARSGAVYEV